MSQEKSNLTNKKTRLPTVQIKSHPPEILELDEETVAIAKAKLSGLFFENIYGDEDRASPELMVKLQAKKIRELFQNPVELKLAFSSEQKANEARKDMMVDGIDLEFIKRYCQKKQLDFTDDAEALLIVGFETHKSGDANV